MNKKYMTASEFLEKKDCICFRDDGSRELYSLSDSDEEDMTDENILKELDAHFINKDLLKDKINKILNEFAKATDVDGRETLYKYTDCDLADLKEDLLEMLK